MSSPVVVGVDGTAAALRAVRWAAVHAGLHDVGLRLVHAAAPPGDRAAGMLRAAMAAADEAGPGVPVTAVTGNGSSAALLVREAEGAGLVVLGGPGRGGYFGTLIGPTAVLVAARAPCPMVVVGGSGGLANGPVVVGVDRTRAGDPVIDFAMREASLRGTGLIAVHGLVAPGGAELDRDRVEEMLADRFSRWTARYPDVKVGQEVVADEPASALLDRSMSAQLVVLGSGRRTGRPGVVLHSTSQRLLRHAPCPVAVVRRDHPS